MNRALTILLLVFIGFQASAQNMRGLMKLVPDDAGLFGDRIQADDINGDGYPDLFISAPATRWQGLSNAGVILMVPGPIKQSGLVSRDSNIVVAEIAVIGGAYANAFLGRVFILGNFNGDDTLDIAATRSGANGAPASVGIYYGPFFRGEGRRTPDIVVESDITGDGFGISLSSIPDYYGVKRDGLLVGANLRGSFSQGRGYLFPFLDDENNIYSVSDARTIFDGPEDGSLFGSTVTYLGDINGDGQKDIGITAPSSSTFSNGFKRGSILLYQGPFSVGTVTTTAASHFKGNRDGNSWGSRLLSVPDLNNDGMHEVAFSSTIEGTMALAYGRTQWAANALIGSPTGKSDSLIFFRGFGNQKGTGISAVFDGDYNRDGIFDPIIGSVGIDVGQNGSIAFHLLSGASRVVYTFGQAHEFSKSMIKLGNISDNDPYAVDDIIVGSPQETGQKGLVYLYRGEINPPSLTFSVSPASFLELKTTATLSLTWTKGSRDISRVQIVRIGRSRRDTLKISNVSAGQTSLSETYNVDESVSYQAQVIDDLGIVTQVGKVVQFAARPGPFEVLSEFTEPVTVTGSRTQSLPFNWAASADTNRLRTIFYQIYFGPTAASFQSGDASLTLVGQSGTTSGNALFGDIKEYLQSQSIPIGSTATVFYNVYASNGVLSTPASNGPKQLSIFSGTLENNLQTKGGNRAIKVFGLLQDGETFTWDALQSDQTDQIVRYQFQLLAEKNNQSRVLLTEFSAENGFKTEYKLTYESIYEVLQKNNLLSQAVSDSARMYYTVRAFINESSYWYANNGPHYLAVKYVRIFNDAEDEVPDGIPDRLTIEPNYPNPFNPSTTIPIGLPEASFLNIEVYNINGQRVYSSPPGGLNPAGWYRHSINLHHASSGVYIVRIQAAGSVQFRKITLLK